MNDGGKNKDYFFEIPEDSTASELMYIRAITAHKDLWRGFYNFEALDVKDDWVVDAWWKYLYRSHPFKAGIIKLDANTYYDWHVDTDRGVGINMLLNNWDTSHCMFNPDLKRGDNVAHGNVKAKFIELKYKPQRYYLFNAQVAHTVYNFGDNTRYLFSVNFEEDRTKLTYNQLLAEINSERWWEKKK